MKKIHLCMLMFTICVLFISCTPHDDHADTSFCEIQTQKRDSTEIEHIRFNFQDLKYYYLDDMDNDSGTEGSIRIAPGESILFQITQNGAPLYLKKGDVISINFQQIPAKRLRIESQGIGFEVTDNNPSLDLPISEDGTCEFKISNLSSEMAELL